MTRIVVFEGFNEIIIGLEKNLTHLKKEWFHNTGRDIESYDIYTCDITNGLQIETQVSVTAKKQKDL